MKNNETIKREHVILCEGEDEKQFLVNYLNSDVRKMKSPYFSENVQVFDFGGIKDLKVYLKAFSNIQGFSMVKSILILRDAELDYKAAISSIQASVRSAGIGEVELPGIWNKEMNYYLGFLLFPSLNGEMENGTLEDLCMRLIKEKYYPEKTLARVSDTMRVLESDGFRTFKHPFKTQLHGFLSFTDGFEGMKIGEATRAGMFDLQSDELEGLDTMLMQAFHQNN